MPLEILQNGRYRILRQLGSGSMGEVYLVEDTRINRQVAIKVIRTESSAYSDPTTTSDAARLFEREARAIARLNHPNILPLYDFGEEVVNGAPLTYMVMPYCAEGSLATWLQQRGEDNLLSPMDVAHFLRQAADALQHAHDNGLIHQDVKPQNFLIRSNRNERLPDLLLADFGIAKLTAGTSGASQAIRGTPIYMAPEQWEGNPVPASDQYALAIMIYQLLTGRPPFQGGPGQLMYKHLSVAPQPPSTLNPILNHDVDTILLHALAKRPENRFPSVSAFGKALQEALLMDGPTILNPQDKPLADANRATLAISYAEALNGTSRTLTIAGGRHVRVDVPPGIQNGQVIRVSGQDSTIGSGGATIPLLLTIAIVPGTLHYPPAFIGNDQMATSSGAAMYTGSDRTSISNNQTVLPDGTRTSISNNPTIIPGGGSPTPVQQPYYSDAAYNNGPYFPQQDDNSNLNQRKRNTGLIILIVALVLLLIFGSAAFAFYRFSSASGTNSANATATAQANDNTVTAQNNATATAQANDTATANAQATTTGNTTATAQANANATATANANKANANATGTAIAQANANATATASASTPTPTPTPFSVKSVTMTVNPTSIAGQTCGTFVTVTYTATFVVSSNSPAGTVRFDYTANNGRSNGTASLTFAAGQTTKTYQFTWSGNLPADHSYPGTGQVITTSPNQVASNAVKPSGQCT